MGDESKYTQQSMLNNNKNDNVDYSNCSVDAKVSFNKVDKFEKLIEDKRNTDLS